MSLELLTVALPALDVPEKLTEDRKICNRDIALPAVELSKNAKKPVDSRDMCVARSRAAEKVITPCGSIDVRVTRSGAVGKCYITLRQTTIRFRMIVALPAVALFEKTIVPFLKEVIIGGHELCGPYDACAAKGECQARVDSDAVARIDWVNMIALTSVFAEMETLLLVRKERTSQYPLAHWEQS